MLQYKTKGFNRLTASGESYSVDLEAIKQNLAQGAPVIIGTLVGGSFMQQMASKDIWLPTSSDYDMRGFGGNAICVIGYDDKYAGGALQIMNSWGEEWENKGIGWVRYKDFLHFTKEAYGLYPKDNAAVDQDLFSIQFGLYDVATKKSIPLNQQKGNVF
jgi:C1A family cysteine protease